MGIDPAVQQLAGAWDTLLARHTREMTAGPTGRALLISWSQPHRRYHNIEHLRDVLAHVDELAEYADDVDAVRLAAWYHDAVYDGAPDDEERSAVRAEHDLTALGMTCDLVDEVARLVRLTATHAPAPGDRNGEVLSDADLAVLAGTPDRYAAYTAAVRAEYAHVDDAAFRAGRAAILRDLMAGPGLFRTPGAQGWQAAAVANLTAELHQLQPTTAS